MTAPRTHKKQPRAKAQKRANAGLLKDAVSPTARLIGYARVSTEDQILDVQLAALKAAGIQPENLYVEKISALNAKRPMFSLMMKFLERGDTLIVHSLSRLGREVKQIYAILDELKAEGVAWRSITEPHLDMTTAMGKFMVTLTGAKDQLERDQISERTTRGIREQQDQGMWIGRRAMFTPAQAKKIKRDRKTMTAKAAAKKWGCSAGTIDKYAN